MQDIYKKFPYNQNNYRQNFIALDVLEEIYIFGKNHFVIDKIFAKGSIIYGTMINGSDIDHVRIKTKKPLNINEKIKLVEELENSLKKFNISKIQRIKEDNYIRVFYDYNELINIPKACTIKDEIYPEFHIICAKNKKTFIKKLYRKAYKYSYYLNDEWLIKTKKRVKLL